MNRQITFCTNHYYGFVVFFLALLGSNGLVGQTIKINFYTGELNEVIQKAQEEGKLIFVDVYSDYCPPCRDMDANVFTNVEIANFYNRNFINYKVNLSYRQNDYFKDLHDIRELPTLMYLSPDGKVLERSSGCKQAPELMQGAVAALNSNRIILPTSYDPEYAKYVEYNQMYNSATDKINLGAKMLREYAYMLKKYRLPLDRVVNEYLQTQVKVPRRDENRKFIFDFSNTIENNAIDFFLKDLQYFKENYGGERINEKIKTAIYNSVLMASNTRNENLFKKAERVAQQAKLPDEVKYLFEIRAQYYQSNSDWSNYAKYAQIYLNTRNISDPILLNDVAKKFHLYINNKKQLKAALKWSKQAVKIESEYDNYLTLGKLYCKLNNYKKAKQAFHESIRIAQTRHSDYQEANELILNLDNFSTKY